MNFAPYYNEKSMVGIINSLVTSFCTTDLTHLYYLTPPKFQGRVRGMLRAGGNQQQQQQSQQQHPQLQQQQSFGQQMGQQPPTTTSSGGGLFSSLMGGGSQQTTQQQQHQQHQQQQQQPFSNQQQPFSNQQQAFSNQQQTFQNQNQQFQNSNRIQHKGVPQVVPNVIGGTGQMPNNQQPQMNNAGAPNLMQKLNEITAPGGDILSKGKELIFMKFGLGGK